MIKDTHIFKSIFTIAAVSVMACLSMGSQAVELYMLPSFSYKTLHDDNYRMRSNGDYAYSEEKKAQAELGVVGLIHSLTINTILSSVDYDAHGDFDSDNQSGDLNYEYKGERFSGGGGGNFSRGGSLADEFDMSGIFISHSVRSEVLNLDASAQWELSPKSTLTASAFYLDRRYVDGASSGLLGSNYLSGTMALYRSFSPRLQAHISTTYSEFESSDSGQKSGSYELALGGNWNANETLKIGAYVGGRQSTSEQEFNSPVISDIDETTNGFYFGANADKYYQRSYLSLSFENSLVPGSGGELLTRRSLSFKFKCEQSEKSNWGFNNRWSDSENVISEDKLQRKFSSLQAYYSYKFSKQLSVSFNLRYRWQKNDQVDDIQESYASWVQLKWVGKRKRF